MTDKRKTKVFGIGLTGLVGSRVVELLGDTYEFTYLDREHGVDITDPKTLQVIEEDTEHPIIIHFAGATDVDGSEKEADLGEESLTYKTNVLGTKNVINAAKKGNKKLIYISTDFVFDGENPPKGGYTEEDEPNPLNWYAKTKYEAEKLVRSSDIPWVIMRIGFPFRKEFDKKKDFVRGLRDRMLSGQEISGVVDQIITPTYIDDIAYALHKLIEMNSTGIFHVCGSESLSSYDIAHMIAKTFGLDESLIKTVTADEFLAGRAPRPMNLTVSNKKITGLGIKMHTFTEALQEIAK